MKRGCHQVQSSRVTCLFSPVLSSVTPPLPCFQRTLCLYYSYEKSRMRHSVLIRIEVKSLESIVRKRAGRMASSSNIVPFPTASANSWVEEYQQACLTPLDAGTIRVYRHILSQFTQWTEKQSVREGQFEPEQIITSLVERYLSG